jgi:hypothetical protein
MKGMFGFIIKEGALVNSVQIQQEVKPGEKYLVQFLNDPTFSRVVQIEEIQSWLLFQNQQLAQNWMSKNQSPPATPPEETPPPGDEPPPPSIEDQLDAETETGNGKDSPDELCIHGVNLYKEYCDQGQCHEWTEKFAPDLLPKAQEESEEKSDDTSDVS